MEPLPSLNIATLIVACALLASPRAQAQGAPTPQDTYWGDAHAYSTGVRFIDEHVELLMGGPRTDLHAEPQIWRWTLAPGADRPQLISAPGNLFTFNATRSMDRFITPAGHLIAHSGMGPSLDGSCSALSLNAHLQQRWYLAWSMPMPHLCSLRAAMPDGGAVLRKQWALERIDSHGNLQWSVAIPSGHPYSLGDGRVVQINNQVWVLDDSSGTVRAIHSIPISISRVFAHRMAEAGLEVLVGTLIGEGGRYSYHLLNIPTDEGVPVSHQLTEGPMALALPHDHGFTLIDTQHIRVFDDLELRWSQPLQLDMIHTYRTTVNGAGAAAIVGPSSIHRFNPAGMPIATTWFPPDPEWSRIALSPAGTLWVIQAHMPPAPRGADVLYRIPAASNVPDLQLRLQLPSASPRLFGDGFESIR